METPEPIRPRQRTENPFAAPEADIRPSPSKPAGATPSPYRIECPCGRKLAVGAVQAGTTVVCECGAEVRVPSLGQLRALTGADPYESGTEDTIRRMVRNGELPWGNVCAVSGEPTGDVLELVISVPRAFKVQNLTFLNLLLAFLVSPLLYGLGLFSRSRPVEESATTVLAPLRVSASRKGKVCGMSQGQLRRLLRTVPVYAKLLDEYRVVRVGVRPEALGTA